MSITVRQISDLENIIHIQEVQRRVWGSELDDIIPTHVPVAVTMSGGGLVCAFADDGPSELNRMIGFAFWWLGAGGDPDDPPGSPQKVKACSHMAGVLPEYQSRGVGAMLKLAQAEAVREQGLTDWITWTYDPLYRGNAVFNIRRLGATSCTFHRDIYGDLPDALNAGWPSDRVSVDWHINRADVLRSAESPRPDIEWDGDTLTMPVVRSNSAGLPVPPQDASVLEGHSLAVPLPDRMAEIRKNDTELAMEWRLYMRETLEQVFAAGYQIVDCINLGSYGWRYILTPR